MTRQEQLDAALRESERRLATLLSNLPGMAYRMRDDAEWTAEFEAPAGREQALAEQIGQGVFQAAFNHLKRQIR